MKIHLPDEISHYEPELRFFFDNMVRKLHTNRHKGFGEGTTICDLMLRLDDEIAELTGALQTEGQFAAFMETVDIANFAWLIGLQLLRQTRKEYEDGRHETQS